ncbi:unnamed protein product [Moneuplotes crassus]|uniref:DUF676 domain-containing protein n=1 Tax=Euplotes crassus TaxID=5936 RepID=A0AAD2D6N2_EUPCR|nr:unnamed protein product [Moneuplotes crassus]
MKKFNKIMPKYTVDYDKFYESETSSSDEEPTSGTSHSMGKFKNNGSRFSKQSSTLIVKEKFGKVLKRKHEAYSQSENINDSSLEELTKTKDFKRMFFTKESILEKTKKEFKKITFDLGMLWKKYLNLIDINTVDTVRFFLYKNLIHYKRMLKMKRVIKNFPTLTRTITEDDLERWSKNAKNLREMFETYLTKEVSRGLCFINEAYQDSFRAVMIQEIYDPDIIQKGLFSVPRIEFEKSYENSEFEIEMNDKRHLVFICHGYSGHYEDLMYLKAAIMENDPTAKVYSCLKDIEKTDETILKLGKIVAKEVKKAIKDYMEDYKIERISLVGYSMGGLIFRAALPKLAKYKDLLSAFVTLATPHLGYLTTNSKLLTAGMWLVEKMKKSTSLKEITIKDQKDFKNCTLYKMSKMEGLEWFDTVALIGSPQDGFSPVESSLIQPSERMEKITTSSNLLLMSDNIIKKLVDCRVHRISVNFQIPPGSIDTMLGRKAHIQFIDNTEILKNLVYTLNDVFYRKE